MTSEAKGRDLFIVDNSVSGWTGLCYLKEWCGIAKSFDIATGYFEIGALLALDGKWQSLDKIRILLGSEMTNRTHQALLQAVKKDVVEKLDASIEADKGADPFLNGVPAILEALRSRQIECRVYDKSKFHAKAYITHAKLEVVGSQALVGSSNFTSPGLTKNIELNIFAAVCDALTSDEIVVSEVNSDNDVLALLNADAELHLRTPYNIFIGGNILDRGITIPNLISFYYGRNPKRMQADTVLQHSRMYGARNRKDLAVTRFYTSREVFQRLETIEQLEAGLRHAFETGAHDRGVAFIQTDASKKVIPCAPNKVAMSAIVSVNAGGRLLPVGFDIRSMTYIKSHVIKIDQLVPDRCKDSSNPSLCDVFTAHQICEEIGKTMDVTGTGWDWAGFAAVIDYFCRITSAGKHKDKIWIAGFTGRGLDRKRVSGRFSNAPDTKQQQDLAEKIARDIPMLLLFRQEGLKEQGWSGHPFWWPVLIAPHDATPCVYATETI